MFWQHFPEPWEIDSLDAGSVVLVPMLDDCPKEEAFWGRYKSCKILCFSSTLGELLRGFGLNVFIVQYFPPVPIETVDWGGEGLRALFWPRKQEVSWSIIRALLSTKEWSGVHLHVTNNLSEVPLGVTREDVRIFNVSTSSWFESAEDYRRVLCQHQVFFAPRRYEGIGLSFLEALCQCMAVISPDNPTMNEYIRSGVNGYLYDLEKPAAPSWDDVRRWGGEARRLSILGRDAWMRAIPGMINFLTIPTTSRKHRVHSKMRARAIIKSWPGYLRYCVWKVLLKLKRRFFPRWKRSRTRESNLTADL